MNLFNYNWVFSQEIISAIITIIIIIITPCLKPNFQHNINDSNQEYSSDEKCLTHVYTHTAAACSSESDVLRKFTGGVESQVKLLEWWGGGLAQCLGKEAMYSHRF